MTLRTIIRNTLFLPASKIYGVGIYVRNKMFDFKILKQHTFSVPIISVGNLAVGGTGKTPHTEYVVDALKNIYHIGVLSRGYKRSTKGFILASARSTPADIGDEAYQVYNKFARDGVVVAVCENRVDGINELLRIDPAISLIVLDDAFQHRYVKSDVSIVLSEYSRPLYNDSLLPYGRLREPRSSLRRADIIIVTKCSNNIKPIDFNIVEKHLDLMGWQHLYFTKFAYNELRPVFPDQAPSTPPYLDWLTDSDMILTIAGIDNPRPFVRFIKSFKAKVRVNVFPDHHFFTRKDINLIRQRYESMTGNRNYIITTEKDAVRLANNPYYPHDLKAVTYYLPIKVDFLRNQASEFINHIRAIINKKE